MRSAFLAWRQLVAAVGIGAGLLAPAFVLGAEAQGKQVESGDVHIRCKGQHGRFACDAYARPSGARVFAKTSKNGEILRQKQFGQWLGMLRPAFEVSNDEWLAVYLVVDGPEGPSTRTITAYVPRSQVILDTDFRRVTGCWPVKYALVPEQSAGDWQQHGVWFTPEGLARGPEGSDYGTQHVYYAEGIFTVRHAQYNNLHLYGHATLDYATRQVKYMGTVLLQEDSKPIGIAWFSPDDLKGCKDIPTVDPHSRAPNPKAFKER